MLDGCAVFVSRGSESGGCVRRFRPLVQSFPGEGLRRQLVALLEGCAERGCRYRRAQGGAAPSSLTPNP